jgi:predicted nucleic acid-binding protein
VRLVLDTNAAVSGLLWHGNPGKPIDAARAGSATLFASAHLLGELHGVLGRDKFTKHLHVRGLSATQMFEGYAALVKVVVPAIIQPVIIGDFNPTPTTKPHGWRPVNCRRGSDLVGK